MATFRSYTGYLTADLGVGQNIGSGETFDIATAGALTIILGDTTGDTLIEGDPAGEVSNDPEGDQVAHILDSGGTALVDGAEVYLELVFTFTASDGNSYTGYQFEIEGSGEDFIILPPGVPAGTNTVTDIDFTPTPDSVSYGLLASGSETVNPGDFVNLSFSGADTIVTGSGDDTVLAGGGADSVLGGAGADSLLGEGGNDTLLGDGVEALPGSRESFNWSLLPDPSGNLTDIDDEDVIAQNTGDSVTQTTGVMDVTVAFTDMNANSSLEFESGDQQLVTGIDTGTETPDDFSAGQLTSTGGFGDSATAEFTFGANTAGFSDNVENVSFRINDIDENSWFDTLFIQAFAADGTPVEVNLSAGTLVALSDTDTVAGTDTASAINGAGNASSTSSANSVLVEIPGPVARIVVDYGNLGTGGQRIDITDIYFDTMPDASTPAGNGDTIDGGAGADSIDGMAGDDLLAGGADDDVISGGTGDDTLLYGAGDGNDTIADFNAGASGTLADGDSSNNDFINLAPFYDNLAELYADQADDGILNQSNATDTKGRAVDYGDNTGFGAGSLTFTGAVGDNSFFTEENTGVVCFTAGTLILTPGGPRAVEDLALGDRVITLDDGPQKIRWIGRRTLGARELARRPNLAPIRIAKDYMGAERDLYLSPQHRVLVRGMRAELLFDAPEVLAAVKNLVDDRHIRPVACKTVTYIHILFDRHQIVLSNGVPTESFHPGTVALDTVGQAQRAELLEIFPDLATGCSNMALARPALAGFEARLLAGQDGGPTVSPGQRSNGTIV